MTHVKQKVSTCYFMECPCHSVDNVANYAAESFQKHCGFDVEDFCVDVFYKYSGVQSQLIEQIRKGLYVDDLIIGADNITSAFQIYSRAKQIMREGGLNLRKWNTNSPELLQKIRQMEIPHDDDPSSATEPMSEEQQTYAQFHTGLLNPTESQSHHKLLGVLWDSQSDELLVDLSELSSYANSLLKDQC